jgi:NAD(P)-dependent dehydrogenase (short-subunit alcohol dehydrogenase family)
MQSDFMEVCAMSTRHPKAPMPRQEQPKPGIESEMKPRPRYDAPLYKGSGKLKDKVALITGGDSGIGRAVAVLFAREGADVAIVYLADEQSDAEETRAAVDKEGRKCLLVSGDVRDPAFAPKAVDRTIAEYGKLHILVNNAAYQAEQKRPEDISEEQLDITFRTNVFGYFHMIKAALAYLPKGGVIINSGSITGFRGSKELIDYAATKGAIHALTKSLAQNLVERRIRVNCVAPGPIWTPFIPSTSADKAEEHGQKVPMERPGQPEEVAPSYVFLASEADSSYITGEILSVLGGEMTGG